MFCRLQTVVNCNCFYVYSELLYSKQAWGESPSFKTIQLDCFRSKDDIRPSGIRSNYTDGIFNIHYRRNFQNRLRSEQANQKN